MMRFVSTPAPYVAERSNTLFLWSALLFALAFVWFIFAYQYVEDDAFIHLEYARSVTEGRGFAFNGLVTNGDTAPAWVLVLAGLHLLGLGWIATAKLACVVGLGVATSGIWNVARDLAVDNRRRDSLAMAATAVTVCNPFFVHWSFSGMESLTALGVSLWAIWAVFLGRPTWTRLLCGALLLGIGPLLRPELLLLGAIAGPALLWRSQRIVEPQSATIRGARIVVLAIVMAMPVAIWCIYATHTFGSIIPNTNLAKRGGPIADLAPRIASVYAVGFPITLALLPFALGRVGRVKVPAAVWVLLLWPVACLAFYLSDHTLVQTRYCLLSMPSLTIAVLYLIDDAGRPNVLRGAVAAMILASLFIVGRIVVPHVENKESSVRALSQLSAFLRDSVPPQSPVAVYAIGELAFASRHTLIDTGGITRPGVIPYLNDPSAQLRWAKANGARYIVVGELPEPGAVQIFATSTPFVGWTLHHSLYQTQNRLVLYKLP